MKARVSKEALTGYEKFIANKKREDEKLLCIEAYEKLLLDQRMIERELLNKKRRTEHDKNRAPHPGWYMGRDKEFSRELYRNRVELRPRG